MPKGPRKAGKVFMLTASAFILSSLIFLTQSLDVFDLKAYDLFSRYLNPQRPSHDAIVLVQVDQESIDALSKEGIHWPWPRQIYAPIIEYLSEAEAVFLDILFTEPSSYGQEDDAVLARALLAARNVYLPLFLTRQQKTMTSADEAFLKSAAVCGVSIPVTVFDSALTPIDLLKGSVKGSGNVTINPDGDGVYRTTPLLFGLRQDVIPHYVLSYALQKGLVRLSGNALYAGDRGIPLVEGNLMVRYFRAQNPFAAFPAIDILRSHLAGTESDKPEIEKQYFRGKIVFVGLTAAGLYDLKPTPVSSVSTGAMIHATTLQNILERNFMRRAHGGYTMVFMFLITLFISYTVLRHHSITRNLAFFLLGLSIAVTVPAVLFMNGHYLTIIYPSLSLMIGFSTAAAYSYAVEGKERRFIKRTFSQYMDEKLVDYVLSNPELIQPGGQRRRVTVFFADMAGFTSLSEKVSPEEIARILHTLLNTFTEVIIGHNGVIDKYIGDCVMAFWGAPLKRAGDEIDACRAALQCLASLDEINRNFRADGLPDIAVRIGIHSGEAIVGNLGSDRLFDYTVVGDTVNLASRLESVNKLFRTNIIISEATLKHLGDLFLLRELGLLEVKGKTVPVRIYELIGESGQAGADTKEMIGLFHRGMDLFRARKWSEAVEVFERVLAIAPHDGPSEFYKKRTECLAADPQLTEQCHIVKMTEK